MSSRSAPGTGHSRRPSRRRRACRQLPTISRSGAAWSSAAEDFTAADFKGDGNLDLSLTNRDLRRGGFGWPESADAIVCFSSSEGTFAAGLQIYSGQTFIPAAGPRYRVQSDNRRFQQTAKQTCSNSHHFRVLGTRRFSETEQHVPTASAVTSFPFVALSSHPLPKPVVADVNVGGKSDLVQMRAASESLFFCRTATELMSRPQRFCRGSRQRQSQSRISTTTGCRISFRVPRTLLPVSINTSLRVDSVLNAASLATNQPVAPGSLVTIFGAGIGPATGIARSGESLPDSAAEVSVTFNGIPAPLSFVSPLGQINGAGSVGDQWRGEYRGVGERRYRRLPRPDRAHRPVFSILPGMRSRSIPMAQSRGQADRSRAFLRIQRWRVIR